MGRAPDQKLQPARVRTYLRAHHADDAEIVSMDPLGQDTQEGLKAYGYGRPLRVRYQTAGEQRQIVLRTMSPDPFGHDRRADRAAEMIDCFDTFGTIPRHIRPLDVGAVDGDGRLVPMAHGELFLVTDFVEGTLYAHDLHQRAPNDGPERLDVARAEALATYLAELHAAHAEPNAHVRDVRDTIGSGEGIFGLCDSYPADHPVATPERLCRLEQAAVAWRWRLRDRARRARRTHGDFHPFNLLFRDGVDFSVLDCSRGGAGEPADDVSCLGLNYLFFALRHREGRFDGAMRALWDAYWAAYLEATGDRELLEVAAPFVAWRGLVLASPVWYPNVADSVREQILRLCERVLDGERFDPAAVDDLLG